MFFHIVPVVLFLSFPSCKDLGIDPPPPPLEPTSHVIQWRTDTVGFQASIARDVTIIDDTTIWVVGEFYLKDSAGNIDQTLYNVLSWNGDGWTPSRLYVMVQGQRLLGGGYAVKGFARNDIWLANAGPTHWDGDAVLVPNYNVNPGTVYKYWGRSSNDLYMISTSGRLTHYDGNQFQSINTGVQSRFCDLYGYDRKLYVVSYYYDNQIRPSGVFRYENGDFQFLFPGELETSEFKYLWNSFGVWVSPQRTVWVVAGGIYVFRPLLSRSPILEANPFSYGTLCIRGLSDADVWVGGTRGYVVHYNGETWQSYPELISQGPQAEYWSIDVKGKLVVLAGYIPSLDRAIVTVGRRGE